VPEFGFPSILISPVAKTEFPVPTTALATNEALRSTAMDRPLSRLTRSTRRERAFFPSSAEVRKLLCALHPLPVLVLVAFALERDPPLSRAASFATDKKLALVEALRAQDLTTTREQIHFVPVEGSRWDVSSPVTRERAFVRAARPGEPSDVYLVNAKRSREGRLVALDGVYNLTDTSAADEQRLVVRDQRAAWTIGSEGIISSVQYADVSGEPEAVGRDWTKAKKLQDALTNRQETGQWRGVLRKNYRLEPQAFKVRLDLTDDALVIEADAHRIVIPYRGKPGEGAEFVRDQTPPKARPGNLMTWAVDRVRALPWFGDDGMAFVKAVAFEGVDQLEQIVNTVTGDRQQTPAPQRFGRRQRSPHQRSARTVQTGSVGDR
jgi:hypothetical protein